MRADDTLATLVTENPARARLLEALALDYCCHGDRTLAAAAAEAGHPVDGVLEALAVIDDASPAVDVGWASLPVPELLDHVVATHHRWLRAEVPRLLPLARKVADVHGERHPELLAIAVELEALWDELQPHLDEEEQDLFPRLALGASVDVAAIREEHEAVGARLDRIRAASRAFAVPSDGCASYRQLYLGLEELDADTRLHVHKENNLVLGAR